MEQTDLKARRKLIEEITKRWKTKNPEAVKAFADNVREMRQSKPYENQAMTYKATIPGVLFRQLDFAVSSSGDPRLFDPDGELAWFAKEFPEFIIPYDASDSVR